MKRDTRVKKKRKRTHAVRKEEIAEDWCFVCKEGGSLRVCDYKMCLKAYHPECVEEDDSFLHSKTNWTCGWHYCFNCNKTSKYHCFCCPYAFCQNCTDSAEFAHIRSNKGFCHNCAKLALLGEADETVDSDGNSLDFRNRETFECLFLEYWVIIKEEENLTSEDLQSANTVLRNWNKIIASDSILVESSASDTMSNSYSEDGKKEGKSTQVMKKSKIEPSRSYRKTAKPKRKFIGWGSEALIEFLASIGKETDKKLSQNEVASIVGVYISENNLYKVGNKRKVLCDARLQSLFQKKTVNKNKIYSLLELHFTENIVVSDDEFWSYVSDDEDGGVLVSAKKKRTSGIIKEAAETDEVQEGSKSRFASIVEENIKLVFLMKSLVKQMLDNHEPEAFDAKVIGCFVKIRSDPMDYLQNNRFQLVLITGVKHILQDDEMKVILQATTGRVGIEFDVEKLIDAMFNKDELDDLRNRVEDGSIPKPTVVELDLKAKSLHVEITNHAIAKELGHLANRIDICNEKGWRAELFKHLDRRELLLSPEEQTSMLEMLPRVLAAPEELNNESPTLNRKACETLGSKEDSISMPFVNGDMDVRPHNSTSVAANETEAFNVGDIMKHK